MGINLNHLFYNMLRIFYCKVLLEPSILSCCLENPCRICAAFGKFLQVFLYSTSIHLRINSIGDIKYVQLQL